MSDVICHVLTPKEARTITHLSRNVLRQMCVDGKIRCGHLPNGERRYWRQDIERLIEDDPAAQERMRDLDIWDVG